MKKFMRLKPRRGPETTQAIGGFVESGAGFSVKKEDGRELGYFGPDLYESIVFEVRFENDDSSVKTPPPKSQ